MPEHTQAHETNTSIVISASAVVDTGATLPWQVKVGCPSACDLRDRIVRIISHDMTVMHEAKQVTFDGMVNETDKFAIQTPVESGEYTWKVKFPQQDLELAHEEAVSTCGLSTAKEPEHIVTVEVIDKTIKILLMNAYLLLRPYKGYTDTFGILKVAVPTHIYTLFVSKNEYQTFKTTVKVAGDITVKTELLAVPNDANEEN